MPNKNQPANQTPTTDAAAEAAPTTETTTDGAIETFRAAISNEIDDVKNSFMDFLEVVKNNIAAAPAPAQVQAQSAPPKTDAELIYFQCEELEKLSQIVNERIAAKDVLGFALLDLDYYNGFFVQPVVVYTPRNSGGGADAHP